MKKIINLFLICLAASLLFISGCKTDVSENSSDGTSSSEGTSSDSGTASGTDTSSDSGTSSGTDSSSDTTSSAITLNASTDLSASSYSSDTVVATDFTILATSAKTVTVSSSSASGDSVGGFTFTKVLALGGSALGATGTETSITYRAVKFDAKSGDTVSVYAVASAARYLVLSTGVSTAEADKRSVGTTATLCQWSITADGTYYLYSANSGINIYYITTGSASYTSSDSGTSSGSDTSSGTDTSSGSGTSSSGSSSIDNATNSSSATDTMISIDDSYTVSETSGETTKMHTITESMVAYPVYAATDGTSSGDGTSANPYDFVTALTKVQAGGAIIMKGGTYSYSSEIDILPGNDGTEAAMKYIMPADGATVVFDFSGESYNSSDTSLNDRGIELQANYWHIYNIKITGAADNGMYVTGNHNIIELCKFDGNRDSGLQIARRASTLTKMADWPSYNLILNCTSCNNSDPATGENADGFAAKLTCGPGNVFDGCISCNNVDDGWDMFAKAATGSIGAEVLRNCISFRNGQTAAGVYTENSDGNGFKLGGSGVGSGHLVQNCLSFENKTTGFTDNNNPALSGVINCTSYGNSADSSGKPNMNLYRVNNDYVVFKNIISFYSTDDTSDKFNGTVINTLFTNSKKYWYVKEATEVANTKAGTEVSPSASDIFVSTSSPVVGYDVHTYWRNSDGTVNPGDFLKISTSSAYSGMGAVFGTAADTTLDITLITK